MFEGEEVWLLSFKDISKMIGIHAFHSRHLVIRKRNEDCGSDNLGLCGTVAARRIINQDMVMYSHVSTESTLWAKEGVLRCWKLRNDLNVPVRGTWQLFVGM